MIYVDEKYLTIAGKKIPGQVQSVTITEEQIEAEADEGYVSIHFKTNPNTERGKLLMDSLILGLTEIEHSYNNRYLTVRVKEV